MKFLRDIIADRSDAQPPGVIAAASHQKAKPSTTDRTMTRLPEDLPADGDDIFRRLMAAEPLEGGPASEADENLFGEIPDDDHSARSATGDLDAVDLIQQDDTNADMDTAALLNALDAYEETEESPAPTTGQAPTPPARSEAPEDPGAHFIRRTHRPMSQPVKAPSVEAEEDTDDLHLAALNSSKLQGDPAVQPGAPAAPTPAPELSGLDRPPQAAFGSLPGRSARALKATPPIPSAQIAPGATTQTPTPVEEDLVAVPAPASGRSGRSAGRVKTRLLGFGSAETLDDPFTGASSSAPAAGEQTRFPVGWLVVISGPGRGASFALSSGVSQIGRGEDQAIRLDFGDTAISRSNHAAIAYDAERGGFYLGHGGKANMVRLNDRPVLSTEEVQNGALIRLGETTLRFVAFCDDSFTWTADGTQQDDRHG